jgi:CHAT domain-containing protein/Tfp pilus assembly protein PilF
MALPLPPRRARSKYYTSLALLISLSLAQIQASPLTSCPTVVNPRQEASPAQPLNPGIPIERELVGGQSHSYLVTLTEGQYVNLVIEQRGIDVTVKLFGPDGKPITEFDSESRIRGEESVSLVAEAAGGYRLSVQPKLMNPAAGRYQIRLGDARAATADDRTLQEARKLHIESGRLGNAGKYGEAQLLAERALEIREKTLGPEHPDVALTVNLLAVLHSQKGEYARAEPLIQRALEIRVKALGPEHPIVAASLNNLALHYNDLNEYEKAEPLYLRALSIWEKALGPEHPNIAVILHNLALLYGDRGDYRHAESYFQRTLDIWEKALGPEHPNVALALNNLAGDYYQRGDYDKAEEIFQRVLAIREKTIGPEHPRFASTLTGLALVNKARNEYAKAELLYQRSLDIQEKALGREHPDVALALVNLARFYHEKGDFARAEPLFQRGLAIRMKTLGPDHRDVGMTLGKLALLYRDMGEYAKAEPLLIRGLETRVNALGLEHPDVADSLNDLALLYAAKGDVAQAISYQSRANAVRERNFAINLELGSERQKLAYVAQFSKETDFTLSLHSQFAPNDPQALNLALTTLLRRKGRGLDAITDTVGNLRRRAALEDRQLFDKLIEARSQLAKLTLRESSRVKPDTYREKLKPFKDKVEKIEAALSAVSAEFRAQTQPATLATIQSALPAGCVLVEFVCYNPQGLQTVNSKPPRYLAYVLANQGQPKWMDIGEAEPINLAIDAWRKALRDPKQTDVRQLARAVDEKVMRPVRSLMNEIPGEIERLLIAPDSRLNLAPFAALVDEQDRYLVERYAISYLTSGRDLLRTRTPQPNKNAALIVANPAFGIPENTHEAADRSQIEADERQIHFQPLPGTEGEAVAIKSVLPGAKVLLWKRATEAAIKQAHAPRILHIATHGFFLSDEEITPAETRSDIGEDPLRMSDLRLSKWAAHIKNPLLRSGLALAGANRNESGDEDGVLTALEVAGLDLWGTELVVLSACDTGVGEVKNGDGVYGLRRALVLAGSETQVISLWPVSDKVTRELMVAYFSGLKHGQGRGEALRRVQLKMIANPKRQHPFYWAAFIQSGEWAKLEGWR